MFPNQTMKVDGTIDPINLAKAIAEVMVKNGGAQYMQKATGAPIGPYLHGEGGIFGVRGLSRGIISTHTQILGSLGDMLPIVASPDTVPLFPYITGFLRSDQQEKNAVCDDPEEASPFKTCIQTTRFGRKEFKTRELEVNRLGQRINRGEFFDLQLENSPLVNSMGGLMRDFFGLNDQQAAIAGNDVVMRMIEVGVAFQRWFCPQVYTGNPGNSSAGGGYKEFAGLDLLISTTKVDAETGQACPSLYSDIKSFGYRQVNSVADPDIVRTITTMMRILNRRAEQQGLAPAQIAIVMREPLFYELTRVWPCQYNTDGCSSPTLTGVTTSIVMNDDFQVRMRDAMRNGKYLLIDGRQVPVILDDCIMEENNADNNAIPIGGFASDIYFVPFTARGGTIRTLYWEYFDFNGPNAAVPSMQGLPKFFWSDGGAFLWTMLTPKVWCVDFAAKVEPRLILRTPQLAGRLTDVVYVPLQHTNDPLPSQDYFVNGGVSTGRPFASPFAEWNLAGPGVQP